MDVSGRSRGPETVGVVATMLILGGIFVFARTITRTIIKPNFGWDDALIIITWFLNLGYSIDLFIGVSLGYGKPVAELSAEQLPLVMRTLTVSEALAVLNYPTGKASIAYLLLRIFPGRTLKWTLWTLVAFNAVFFYLNAVLMFCECRPLSYTWDRSISGSCWNPDILRTWGWLTGIFGAFTDFTFATLPWFYVRKLQMKTREKVGVCLALGMGLLATTCCIVKIVLTVNFWQEKDVTYGTVPLVLWSSAELGLINIAACIPTLRPLYLWLTGKDSQNGSLRNFSPYHVKEPASSRDSSGFLGSQRKTTSFEYKPSATSDAHIYQVRSYEVSYQDRQESC